MGYEAMNYIEIAELMTRSWASPFATRPIQPKSFLEMFSRLEESPRT